METSRYWQSGDLEWFADRGQYEGLRSIGNLLEKETTKKRRIKGKQLDASWDHAYLRRLLNA